MKRSNLNKGLALALALAVAGNTMITSASTVKASGLETSVTDVVSDEGIAVDSEDGTSSQKEEAAETDIDNSSSEASSNEEVGSTTDDTSDEGASDSSDSENTDATEDANAEATEGTDAETADNAENEAASDESTKAADDTTAEEAKGEEASDKFEFSTDFEGYIIKLSAEKDVVPDGTEVKIERLKGNEAKDTDELVNDALPDNAVVYDSASFDISLWFDGVEIEPNGNVSVVITLDDELAEKNEDKDTSIQVFHIDDAEQVSEVEADTELTTEGNNEDTVVSYDAESFSVYDVAVVLNFDISEPVATVNSVYEDKIDVDEISYLSSDIDCTENIKTLMADPGIHTSFQTMGEAVRAAIKNRQDYITLNLKLPGNYNKDVILQNVLDIAVEHTGVPNEGDYVRWAYYGTGTADATAYANKCTYGTFSIRFAFTQTAAQEVETTAAVNKLVKQFNSGSDYDKVTKLYRYLINNVTYDHNGDNDAKYNNSYYRYSCHSAAISKHTVCEGYSLLFYRICLSMGIDARLVAGLGGSGSSAGPHGWNIVQIGDYFYYVDSTWGADESYDKGKNVDDWEWFLRGTACGFDTLHQRYGAYLTSDFINIYPVNYYDYATYYPSPVKATSVNLSQTSATISVGGSFTLTASVTPASSPQLVKWNSSDYNVATVDANGTVRGVGYGVCEIFATSSVGGKKAVCRVTVVGGLGKDIQVVTKKLTVYKGYSSSLNASIWPEGASGKLKFSSSNSRIASVTKKGVVKGKNLGKCVITVKSNNGLKVKVKVTVKAPTKVKSVKLNTKKLVLQAGQVAQLYAKVKPAKAYNKAVTYKSSKKSVASVDANGVVYAYKKGKCTITVTTKDGKKKAKCKVIVN
ncbi:Ig-like domain-containing protein [Butyrivibrio sp. WCD3002]|uniref:Ig-like domain-containing protein n=1 Tax=Butyrivibrio sp. WCD3002 TaxID=1280676 RepID=UPI00042188ED|nr:Ig-like domain-containing protein [Butyrivibrio sp. WCD3002]